MVQEVRIGEKILGKNHPTLISFEAGATHDGLESAMELTRIAAENGADAIKFQTILHDEFMSEEAKKTSIEYQTPGGMQKELVSSALKRRELNFEQWKKIRNFLKSPLKNL